MITTTCSTLTVSFNLNTDSINYWKRSQLTLICSKLTVETLEKGEICSKVNNKNTGMTSLVSSKCFFVNFEHIPHQFVMFLLLTLNK